MLLWSHKSSYDHGLCNIVTRLKELPKELTQLHITLRVNAFKRVTVAARSCRLPIGPNALQSMPLTDSPSAKLRSSSNTVDRNRRESNMQNPISLTGTPNKRRGEINCLRDKASCSGDVVIRQRLADCNATNIRLTVEIANRTDFLVMLINQNLQWISESFMTGSLLEEDVGVIVDFCQGRESI